MSILPWNPDHEYTAYLKRSWDRIEGNSGGIFAADSDRMSRLFDFYGCCQVLTMMYRYVKEHVGFYLE